jgi:hypothetical protein
LYQPYFLLETVTQQIIFKCPLSAELHFRCWNTDINWTKKGSDPPGRLEPDWEEAGSKQANKQGRVISDNNKHY